MFSSPAGKLHPNFPVPFRYLQIYHRQIGRAWKVYWLDVWGSWYLDCYLCHGLTKLSPPLCEDYLIVVSPTQKHQTQLFSVTFKNTITDKNNNLAYAENVVTFADLTGISDAHIEDMFDPATGDCDRAVLPSRPSLPR